MPFNSLLIPITPLPGKTATTKRASREPECFRPRRALFLNARAAMATAPRVAALMARELGRDDAWQAEQIRAFEEVARNYNVML